MTLRGKNVTPQICLKVSLCVIELYRETRLTYIVKKWVSRPATTFYLLYHH